jgi:hypothetical protein
MHIVCGSNSSRPDWSLAPLCLLLAARRSGGRFALCSAAVLASIVLGNHNTGHQIVLWWPALMASLVVMLASASWVPRATR